MALSFMPPANMIKFWISASSVARIAITSIMHSTVPLPALS
jgi:hypothetical protein